ncbi:Os01g0937366 [Oryza sativa Japonica Group]|uniref:Os01g0937366 protein n=2 Tax=Oryza sativa subsp. japonica TaxID=39947 RepID=C7IX48_ORYSJ|nr:hypothetical protein EE612_007863 [Oryza sativa]BAH91463.1 Os01g0937366 [Oryza sativa Japonica Group]BAS76120.1 Os01g0937366 [Oryza sativa Japonica Group]|eukprot:NP_001172733.1 Os01g0937366 [Oryza sativa Japonica Group]
MGAGESSNGLTLGMHGIDPRWRRLPWRRRTVQCRARAATSSHDMSTPTPGGRRPDFFLVDGDAPEERMLLTSDGVGGQRHQIVRPTPEEGHATPDVAPVTANCRLSDSFEYHGRGQRTPLTELPASDRC